MIANKKASVVAHTGLMNPFNFAHQKAQTVSNTSFHANLTQAEKLRADAIFKCLIAGLRGERFMQDGEFMNLVYDLPKLSHSKNFGDLEQDELWKLGVCSIPNFILNALVCQQLAKRFGDLSICGCFYKIDGYWRLDIDSKLSSRGLLLPLRSRLTGLIYALKAYRFPDDSKPFKLKLRGGLSNG